LGFTGQQGATGDIGPQGPVGFPGPQGTTGNIGPQGQPGRQGATGFSGTTGQQGTVVSVFCLLTHYVFIHDFDKQEQNW